MGGVVGGEKDTVLHTRQMWQLRRRHALHVDVQANVNEPNALERWEHNLFNIFTYDILKDTF